MANRRNFLQSLAALAALPLVPFLPKKKLTQEPSLTVDCSGSLGVELGSESTWTSFCFTNYSDKPINVSIDGKKGILAPKTFIEKIVRLDHKFHFCTTWTTGPINDKTIPRNA